MGVQLGGQLSVADLLARLEVEVHDVLLDEIIDLVLERGGWRTSNLCTGSNCTAL